MECFPHLIKISIGTRSFLETEFLYCIPGFIIKRLTFLDTIQYHWLNPNLSISSETTPPNAECTRSRKESK